MSFVGIKCGIECVDKMECVWTEMNEGFERGVWPEAILHAYPPC